MVRTPSTSRQNARRATSYITEEVDELEEVGELDEEEEEEEKDELDEESVTADVRTINAF